ncbi:phosphocholine-specific phospholipase C [Oharaeibacter diazotrophicus]|uniref:phospholipase C n=1 Tax=Oharaeibacter diazotrophicus TaxID=1920512 RepID=A0A4V3CWN6_9HYPH|nr:phospholipase C, phosphocholine-specific [Oharaeibacter diazotrophicus]TDP87108.1 phospholipase C [Oharaeibacter diazotrophicus]BBE70949.1 non-hemolytic phospholipase C precursor [Pleomorphomonas sp. SM30]GLS77698.1 non-hemolytic phospholipase C [Oharaeibacter diazotrophicus]
MAANDRREFLKLIGSGAFAASMTGSIERALAIPAEVRTGTIRDVEHIVVLMQENRSFDHYFGTMRGVRGFEDPRPVRLSTGKTVWAQPSPTGDVLPFRPDANFGEKFLEDVAHGWADGQMAWNEGKYDQWIPAKGVAAMTYYLRKDIPYHFALADAFTVCDNYFCSLIGPTDPNRYHMFSGWVGNDGKGGGPVIDNAEAGYDWSTFPERLQKAGISWKVYQDVGDGLTQAGFWGWTGDPYIGNYGDNSLLYFHQYQNAAEGSPLAQRARTGTNIKVGGTLFDVFAADVKAGRLPKVSYIAAPEAYSEHPNWIPNYGAWYISQILDILTANPEVWAKTVLIINYDENGGFYDHVVPPTAPMSPAHGKSTVSIENEIFEGSASHPEKGPYGFCSRVPMLAISPWSKGGWVNSQVFDHTSVIRFIEKRFEKDHPDIREDNITPWRRAVAGDLTTAFDFTRADSKVPRLPSTAKYAPADRTKRYDDYHAVVPAKQTLPGQEKGMRPARPLPYRIDADLVAEPAKGTVSLAMRNAGSGVAAFFHVRTAGDVIAPRGHTVGARAKLNDALALAAGSTYEVTVHGPNGFYRALRGKMAVAAKSLAVTSSTDHAATAVTLQIRNTGTAAVVARIANVYTGKATNRAIAPGKSAVVRVSAKGNAGWYDLVVTVLGVAGFRQQFAGHVENGKPSYSDPAIGAA